MCRARIKMASPILSLISRYWYLKPLPRLEMVLTHREISVFHPPLGLNRFCLPPEWKAFFFPSSKETSSLDWHGERTEVSN